MAGSLPGPPGPRTSTKSMPRASKAQITSSRFRLRLSRWSTPQSPSPKHGKDLQNISSKTPAKHNVKPQNRATPSKQKRLRLPVYFPPPAILKEVGKKTRWPRKISGAIPFCFQYFSDKPPGFNILQTVTTCKLLNPKILPPKYQNHFSITSCRSAEEWKYAANLAVRVA